MLATHLFVGEVFEEAVGPGWALWSLNVWSLKEDCLLLAAGDGKGSDLKPAAGVGSAGRASEVPLACSFVTFLDVRPSPARD